MRTPQMLMLPFAAILFTVSATADSVVYVVNGAQQFGTVDLATGAFSAIGPGTPEGEYGLIPGPNGSLLTLTYSGNLDSINPATGATSVVGATGLGNCTLLTDPCGPNSANVIGRLGGTVYVTDFANNLYSVNTVTGAATLVGKTGMPALPSVPFSMNPDGSLNVYDENLFSFGGKLYSTFDAGDLNPMTGAVTPVIAPDLYQIDPATGVATLISPTTFGLSGIVVSNGSVYGFDLPDGTVVSLDLTNGNTTFVSNVDPNAGIIQGATAATPEPVSIELAGLGIASLAFWRRRRR